jgi:DNA-binding NtrC family response regulator
VESEVSRARGAASTAAGFIAESPQSKQLVAMVRRVAPSRSTALIEGESGTGKDLIARMLHYWSSRADGPFIAVNCKAFADGVVESELFGHEKGSFTGAIADRAGCFERASGGTLFLDEIAEARPDFQIKLLRVLEDGEVLRVGADFSSAHTIPSITPIQTRKHAPTSRCAAAKWLRLRWCQISGTNTNRHAPTKAAANR